MFNKSSMTIAMIFCCFFQYFATYSYTRNELEYYLGKPVFRYQLIDTSRLIDTVVEDWIYTTELSKLLLISDRSEFSLRTGIFAFKDLFFDSRFESFIQNVGKFSQSELQETIKDAIVLAPFNNRSYIANTLLDGLIDALQNKIALIKDQVAYNSVYEVRSLESMKKSVPLAAFLLALVINIQTNNEEKYSFDNRNKKEKMSDTEVTGAVASLLFLPVCYKAIKDSYNVLTVDHTIYTNYLDEFETLLIFVKELKTELQAHKALSFKLASGYTAKLEVHDGYFGKYETVIFE